MIKPSIPKGTRDFSPSEVRKREYIFNTIREVFRLYGFEPLETPAMENLSTLTGKYGDEGDQLIFKILNSGDFSKNIPAGEGLDPKMIAPLIAEKALRYDLTIPFARYVVQHQHELTFPFRRYQIQPVWRADRPQKGRYREFYQCDADVIGSDSLQNEADLISIIDMVFSRLNAPVTIKINNRKILQGIAEESGISEHFIAFTVAIDKLEKIGEEKVKAELTSRGISPDQTENAFRLLGKGKELLNQEGASETLQRGVEEVNSLLEKIKITPNSLVELDLTLARGLNYYTGTIMEVKSREGDFNPTICAGGRYDDLTGIFGLPGMSGVGISFGADRIYDVLEMNSKFPAVESAVSEILFVNFGEQESIYANEIASSLRKEGISAEVYPDPVKMKKQMSYAAQKKIPFTAIIGSEEIEKKGVMLKNMESGEQQFIEAEALIRHIRP